MQELTIKLPGDATDTAVVQLQLTWTRVVAVRGVGVEIELQRFDPSGPNLRLLIQSHSGNSLPEELVLQVDYRGETPEVRAAKRLPNQAYAAATKRLIAATATTPQTIWAHLRTVAGAAELLADTPIADEYGQRGARCNLSDTAHGFFYQLDCATYWPLLYERGESTTSQVIEELGYHLGVRSLRRATRARYGLRFEGLLEDEGQRTNALIVAAILRYVFALVTVDGHIQIEVLDGIVRRFLVGDLRVDLGDNENAHGLPNSANFFAFPELLYLFRDLDIDRDYWQEAISTFVIGTQVFTQLYWSGQGRSSMHYGPQFLSADASFTTQQWQALRDNVDYVLPRFLTRDHLIEEYFGDALAHALRDQTFMSPERGLFLAAPFDQRHAHESAPAAERSKSESQRRFAAATMTLVPRVADVNGYPIQPTGDLLDHWNYFQECVATHETCNESNQPSVWNTEIFAHMIAKIIPCTTAPSGYSIDTTNYKASRQSATGWEDAMGAVHCAVKNGGSAVAYFGCERKAGVIVPPWPLRKVSPKP